MITPPMGERTRSVLRIASAQGVPGTAGALVRDRNSRPLILTAHHVAFGGGTMVGDRVWALPDEDTDNSAALLGRVLRGVLGRVTFAKEIYFVDCALVTLTDGSPSWLSLLLEDMARPARHVAASTGLRVHKRGGATGHTVGVVANATYSDYPYIEGRFWPAPGQLLVDTLSSELLFSCPGDSGAMLYDNDENIVGLLWGASGHGQGVACPIEPVLDSLGVTLNDAYEDSCEAIRRHG
jgi:hypothetical protein